MKTQVAIIGAGISGLVAGILLKNRGMEVTVFEKSPDIKRNHIGGALTIWPNGAQVLLGLRCGPEIKKLAGVLRYQKWSDEERNTLRTDDRDALLKVNGHPLMQVCRSDLQQLLLQELGNSHVVFNAECTAIEQNSECAVVKLKNGETVQADLVIGADGTFSPVRRAIFPEAKVEYAGYVSLVGICEFPELQKPKHNFICAKNRLLLTFPIANNRYMVYTICPLPEGQLKEKYGTTHKQIGLFCGWSTEADAILIALKNYLLRPEFAEHYYCNENHEMPPLSSLHHGRVVLVGDAAHPMGSINAFNTNLALEDVRALVDQVTTEKDLETALLQFEREQLPRIAKFMSLESREKNSFLNPSDEAFARFKQFVKTLAQDDFFRAVVEALRPAEGSQYAADKEEAFLAVRRLGASY